MSNRSDRPKAAHVQAAIAATAQPKEDPKDSSKPAPHVQAAIQGTAAQTKMIDQGSQLPEHVREALKSKDSNLDQPGAIQPAKVATRVQPPRSGKRKRVVKKSRVHSKTRAGKRRRIQGGDDGSGGGDPPKPNKCALGKDLWKGTRRELRWLDYNSTLDQLSTVKGRNRKGKTTYPCAKCGRLYPQKRDLPRNQRRTKRHIEIDHRTSALNYVLSKTDPRQFQLGENCWEAYYLEDVLAAYNDLRNLQLLCSHCNASKSGRKDIDKSDPTRFLGKK